MRYLHIKTMTNVLWWFSPVPCLDCVQSFGLRSITYKWDTFGSTLVSSWSQDSRITDGKSNLLMTPWQLALVKLTCTGHIKKHWNKVNIFQLLQVQWVQNTRWLIVNMQQCICQRFMIKDTAGRHEAMSRKKGLGRSLLTDPGQNNPQLTHRLAISPLLTWPPGGFAAGDLAGEFPTPSPSFSFNFLNIVVTVCQESTSKCMTS